MDVETQFISKIALHHVSVQGYKKIKTNKEKLSCYCIFRTGAFYFKLHPVPEKIKAEKKNWHDTISQIHTI